MIDDIVTVVRKEWAEMKAKTAVALPPRIAGVVRFALAGVVVAVGAAGGRVFVDTPIAAFVSMMTIFGAIAAVAESFAGERERHTLETLLASRLPDEAILLGKIAANITYAFGVGLMMFLLILIGVNLRHFDEAPLFYTPSTWIAATLMNFTLIALVVTAGVFISLRSTSVEQAQTKLFLIFFALLIPLVLIRSFVPEPMIASAQAMWSTEAGRIRAIVSQSIFFGGVDVLLLVFALTRFRRARLIAGL